MKKNYDRFRNFGLSLLAATAIIGTSEAQRPAEVAPFLETFSNSSLPTCWQNNSTSSGNNSY